MVKRIGITLFMMLFVLTLTLPGFSSTHIYHITITGTGDLQGALDGYNGTGGIAKISTIIHTIIKSNPGGVVVVSSGDDLMGRYFHKFQGKAIYSTMWSAGYKFCALGNHEFDEGDAVLGKALGYAKCTVLCSDLRIKGTPIANRCEPYAIIDLKGLKIGIFSLMTTELPLISSPGKVSLTGDNIEMAKKMVKLLRGKGADVIVAVTHIGYSQDREVAKHVKGITVIFGGHSHAYLSHAAFVNGTVIVNGGELGKYVVRLDIYLTAHKKLIPKLTKYKLIPVNSSVKPYTQTENMLKAFRSQLPPAVILGKTDVNWDLRDATLRFGESGFADAINDLLKKQFKVNVVLNNSGLFRGGKVYKKGYVTDTMLHTIYEFNNVAFLLKLRGKYIKQILEHSAAEYGRGGWLQVAGLRYTVDLHARKQVLSKCGNSYYVKVSGRRVKHIMIDGKPLDYNKLYTVLTNDFMERGGDGYFWFKKYGKDIKNTYTTYYSITASYIKRKGTFNPPPPDGRIKIMK